MKTLETIILSIVTTVATMVAFLFVFEYQLVPIASSYEQAPIVTTTTMQNHDNNPTVTVVNHEEAQMDAIDKVAEAIVGVLVTTEAPTSPFGFGSWGGPQAGSGSGIVYAVRDGNTYIVTNEHVIDRAQTIEIVFNDENQTRKMAELIGSDVYTDIAVLRINDFEANVIAEFGNTADLRLGQTVIAIGNPLGLEFAGSATMGVVSGQDRSVSIPILSTNGHRQEWPMTVLQTDTAINPGNSGGALINLAGQVVGINSMKIAQSAVEGMSFSIPTDIALPIIADLENYGVIKRPLLGVSLQNVNALPMAIRQQINLPDTIQNGVFVQEVMPNSLATELELEPGDVITHIGAIAVSDATAFRQTLFTYRSGDEIALTFVREGVILTASTSVVLI